MRYMQRGWVEGGSRVIVEIVGTLNCILYEIHAEGVGGGRV